jgi:hypothetical protein
MVGAFFLLAFVFSPIMFLAILIMGVRSYSLYRKKDKEWRSFLIPIALISVVFLPFLYYFLTFRGF